MLGIIINPKSGKKAYRYQRLYLFKLLKKRHQPFMYKVTKYASHATELARELVERGCDQILVLGGDGTLSEVVNGIMSAKVADTSNIQLGLMPRGTGNDWGRFWGLDRRFRRSLDVFFNSGEAQPIDIGEVAYFRNGEEKKHYFINSVGFGVDAVTVHYAHVLKYYVGSHRLLYFFALLAALVRHKPSPLHLKTDDGLDINGKLFTMNIGNGPFSGGGIRQNPDADPRDGVFHSMFVSAPTAAQMLKGVTMVFNGGLKLLPFVKSFTAKEVELVTSKFWLFEADGILVEACGPYTIRNHHHAIKMVAPKI